MPTASASDWVLAFGWNGIEGLRQSGDRGGDTDVPDRFGGSEAETAKFDFCHFQENGNSENTAKMGKRTFLKPRPNARVFKNSRPRIECRNFGAVKTGNFRVLGFCQKGQKSS